MSLRRMLQRYKHFADFHRPAAEVDLLPVAVTVHVSLLPDSMYPKIAFELAEKYFMENLGISVQFSLCDEIPQDLLDHRTQFGLIEADPQKIEGIIEKNLKSDFVKFYEKLEIMNASPQFSTDQIHEYEMQLDNAMDWKRQSMQKEYLTVGGETSHPESTIYVTNTKNIRILQLNRALDYSFNQSTTKPDGLSLAEQIRRSTKNLASKESIPKEPSMQDFEVRDGAFTVVHELGHLAGLWHTFQFKNDGLKDKISSSTNVMSYEPIGKGAYGFTMTKGQQDQARDFIMGGEHFQMMKDHGFDFTKYSQAIANSRRYNFRK